MKRRQKEARERAESKCEESLQGVGKPETTCKVLVRALPESERRK
jgi:hypothetical protein